jgi:hypothetical protein
MWRFAVDQGAQLLLTLTSYALFTAGGLAVYAYVWASNETVSVYLHESIATPTAALAGVALMLLGVALGFWNYRRVRQKSKRRRMQRREHRG